MKDLAPWEDADCTQLERELLHAGKSDHIPDVLAQRMSQALGLPPLPYATSPSAARDVATAQHKASSWSWWAGKPAAWTLLSVFALGALVAARRSEGAADARAPAQPTHVAVTDRQQYGSVEPLHNAQQASGDEEGAPHAPPESEVGATPRAWQRHDESAPRRRAAEPSPTDHLREEVALIDRARFAISHADPERALAVLEQHARRYRAGLLLPEAEALRIEALLARGDGSTGRARLKSFLRSHPDSPLTQRLKRLEVAERAPSTREQE